jgi:hypothetical protein
MKLKTAVYFRLIDFAEAASNKLALNVDKHRPDYTA